MTTPTSPREITEADIIAAKRATLNLSEILKLLKDEGALASVRLDMQALMKVIRHAEQSIKN